MTIPPTFPKEGSQKDRILQALLRAEGDWINGQYFLRTLYLSQFHARIKELEDDHHWPIEHSEFKDEHLFISYRLPRQEPMQQSLL